MWKTLTPMVAGVILVLTIFAVAAGCVALSGIWPPLWDIGSRRLITRTSALLVPARDVDMHLVGLLSDHWVLTTVNGRTYPLAIACKQTGWLAQMLVGEQVMVTGRIEDGVVRVTSLMSADPNRRSMGEILRR